MADLPGHSRAQTKFLRACLKDPHGLTSVDWPNAATFRRWMRRATFRKAIQGIRDALRLQADLRLTAVAAAAARALTETVANPQADEDQLARQREQLKDLITLLKLVHTRERFTAGHEPPEPAPARRPPQPYQVVLKYLRERDVKPYQTIGEFMKFLETFEGIEPQGRGVSRTAAIAIRIFGPRGGGNRCSPTPRSPDRLTAHGALPGRARPHHRGGR